MFFFFFSVNRIDNPLLKDRVWSKRIKKKSPGTTRKEFSLKTVMPWHLEVGEGVDSGSLVFFGIFGHSVYREKCPWRVDPLKLARDPSWGSLANVLYVLHCISAVFAHKNGRRSGYGGRTVMQEGSVEPDRQDGRVGGMPEGVARSPGVLWPGNLSPMVKKSCFWSSGTYRALKSHFSELNFFPPH